MTLWIGLGGLVVASFGIGFSVASWQPIGTLLSNWADKSKQTISSAPAASSPTAAVVSSPRASEPLPKAVADHASDPGIFKDLKPNSLGLSERSAITTTAPPREAATAEPKQAEAPKTGPKLADKPMAK